MPPSLSIRGRWLRAADDRPSNTRGVGLRAQASRHAGGISLRGAGGGGQTSRAHKLKHTYKRENKISYKDKH